MTDQLKLYLMLHAIVFVPVLVAALLQWLFPEK